MILNKYHECSRPNPSKMNHMRLGAPWEFAQQIKSLHKKNLTQSQTHFRVKDSFIQLWTSSCVPHSCMRVILFYHDSNCLHLSGSILIRANTLKDYVRFLRRKIDVLQLFFLFLLFVKLFFYL